MEDILEDRGQYGGHYGRWWTIWRTLWKMGDNMEITYECYHQFITDRNQLEYPGYEVPNNTLVPCRASH